MLVGDLPNDVLARFELQARQRKRSLEQEASRYLAPAAQPSREEIIAKIDRIRPMTPRKRQSDSTDLIREARVRGWD